MAAKESFNFNLNNIDENAGILVQIIYFIELSPHLVIGHLVLDILVKRHLRTHSPQTYHLEAVVDSVGKPRMSI